MKCSKILGKVCAEVNELAQVGCEEDNRSVCCYYCTDSAKCIQKPEHTTGFCLTARDELAKDACKLMHELRTIKEK